MLGWTKLQEKKTLHVLKIKCSLMTLYYLFIRKHALIAAYRRLLVTAASSFVTKGLMLMEGLNVLNKPE